MSLVKISELSEVPGAETGKSIHLEHPWTHIEYDLALFKVEGNYYVLTDKCYKCGGSLGKGKLQGLFAICSNEECRWNIKKGYCKFDRSCVMSTYKVMEQEDGLFINI